MRQTQKIGRVERRREDERVLKIRLRGASDASPMIDLYINYINIRFLFHDLTKHKYILIYILNKLKINLRIQSESVR